MPVPHGPPSALRHPRKRRRGSSCAHMRQDFLVRCSPLRRAISLTVAAAAARCTRAAECTILWCTRTACRQPRRNLRRPQAARCLSGPPGVAGEACGTGSCGQCRPEAGLVRLQWLWEVDCRKPVAGPTAARRTYGPGPAAATRPCTPPSRRQRHSLRTSGQSRPLSTSFCRWGGRAMPQGQVRSRRSQAAASPVQCEHRGSC
jgi:hypothetical protein